MFKQDNSLSTVRQLISQTIELVPTHREPPRTLEAIASGLEGVSPQEATTITATVLAMLDLLGVLGKHEEGFQTSHQVPTYFLRSLAWYFKHNTHLLENWTRTGVNTEVSATSLLETAPYFLKIMEIRRLLIGREQGIEVLPSREQEVVSILVKGRIGKKDYYLHEWDRRAEQYQLIGGRIEPGESPIVAARRELIEELDIERQQRLSYERDFKLHLLTNSDQPVNWTGISQTYGALTNYYFWVCSAEFKVKELKLRDNNRWLTIDEMMSGETKTGKKIGNSEVYSLMNAQIPGGLNSVPVSIDLNGGRNYLDYLEVKPGFYGIVFDVKRFLSDTFSSKR